MNQLVDETAILSAMPIPVSRKDRLREWARSVRECGHSVALLSNLEHLNPDHHVMPLGALYGIGTFTRSAFGLAAANPAFREQGYQGETLKDAMGFFELTQDQLHQFACDCGGSLSNEEMARRIDNL